MVSPLIPTKFRHDIPRLSPLSAEYTLYWKEQKKKSIEGTWVDGYFIPPILYFFSNFVTIRRQPSAFVPSAKIYARPDTRDVEWEVFSAYTVARGFSGFEDDPNYTALTLVLNEDIPLSFFEEHYPSAVHNGKLKQYKDPLSLLTSHSPIPLGRPLFENPKKNLLILGSRDLGKSYWAATMIAHTFLFDAATKYPTDVVSPSEVVVGASVSDKSADLLKKVKDIFDHLPYTVSTPAGTFPPPFYKNYVGTFAVNSEIRAEYKKKVAGRWITAGSRSTIKHRSFNENPFAAQGTRPDLLVIEEVGLCPEFKDIYLHTVDALRRGLDQTGSLVAIGTGGDMEKGTLPVSEIFYDPDKYNFISYEDTYEHRGRIALFIPAIYSLDQFRDEYGNVDHEKATAKVLEERKKKKSSLALEQEMQYRPLKPSEMFLARSYSFFPTLELRNRLAKPFPSSTKVELFFSSSTHTGVDYEINDQLQVIDSFPYDEPSKEGAIQIWEFPIEEDGVIPDGLYIIGCDPFKDDNPSGPSLAAIYVLKTSRYPHLGHEEIVASYVGRPYEGKNAVNEILHKLALFYNAKIYFENSVGNVKDYFEKVQRLDLLALQPSTVFNKKASYATDNLLVYGYPMSNQRIKMEAISYVRSFLLTSRDDNRYNLDLIPDKALVQELIAFNMEGSFDRVMALVGCVIGLEETSNKRLRQIRKQQSALDEEIERILVKNPKIFPHGNTSTSKTFAF